jgi:hypothetical protein
MSSTHTKIEDIIEIPDNPEGSGFSKEQWSEMMQSIWIQWWKIYYRTHRDEIDTSLQDFTNKVFVQLGKYVEALENAEKNSPSDGSSDVVNPGPVLVPSISSTDAEDDTDAAVTT